MKVDSVIRLAFGRTLIPFQVSVTWTGYGARPQTQLREKVTLTGVKELSNSLTVTLPQLCTGMFGFVPTKFLLCMCPNVFKIVFHSVNMCIWQSCNILHSYRIFSNKHRGIYI